MIASEDCPEAPDHLSDQMQGFWTVIHRDLDLEPHQVLLVKLACEAYDRAQAARKVLDEQGMTYVDKAGQPKPRPECTIEHNARLDFSKLLRDAGLDDPGRMFREHEQPNPYVGMAQQR